MRNNIYLFLNKYKRKIKINHLINSIKTASINTNIISRYIGLLF